MDGRAGDNDRARVCLLHTAGTGSRYRVVHVPPRADPADIGGLCSLCMGLICPKCVGKGCDPLEKKLERQEAHYHALRSYGLLDGGS